MKNTLLLLIIFQFSILFSQKENDFHFTEHVFEGISISSNEFNNLMIYHKYDEINEIRYNAHYSKISKTEKLKFQKSPYYLNPFCDLFYSNKTRFKYVIREIDTEHPNNYGFVKGERKFERYLNDAGYSYLKDTIYEEKDRSLLDVIKTALGFGQLTVYEKGVDKLVLEKQSELCSYIDSNFSSIRYLRLKEAVYYDYFEHSFKTKILGLGLILKDMEYWFFYPELKYVTATYGLSRYTIDNEYCSWDKILGSGIYESKVIFDSKTQNHPGYFIDYYEKTEINQGAHRNQYDCYFYLNELLRTKKAKLSADIKYDIPQQLNGIKEYVDSYKNLKVKIGFENGIANGIYNSRYSNGVTCQKGGFKNNRKHGIWFSYYPNGKLMAKRTYLHGLENGEFSVYYDNENSLMTYNYVKGMLQGDFERKLKSGVILEKGQFKDNFVNGKWKISYLLPQWYIDYIKQYPIKGFDLSTVKNGMLEYQVKLEQYNIALDHYQMRVRIVD